MPFGFSLSGFFGLAKRSQKIDSGLFRMPDMPIGGRSAAAGGNQPANRTTLFRQAAPQGGARSPYAGIIKNEEQIQKEIGRFADLLSRGKKTDAKWLVQRLQPSIGEMLYGEMKGQYQLGRPDTDRLLNIYMADRDMRHGVQPARNHQTENRLPVFHAAPGPSRAHAERGGDLSVSTALELFSDFLRERRHDDAKSMLALVTPKAGSVLRNVMNEQLKNGSADTGLLKDIWRQEGRPGTAGANRPAGNAALAAERQADGAPRAEALSPRDAAIVANLASFSALLYNGHPEDARTELEAMRGQIHPVLADIMQEQVSSRSPDHSLLLDAFKGSQMEGAGHRVPDHGQRRRMDVAAEYSTAANGRLSGRIDRPSSREIRPPERFARPVTGTASDERREVTQRLRLFTYALRQQKFDAAERQMAILRGLNMNPTLLDLMRAQFETQSPDEDVLLAAYEQSRAIDHKDERYSRTFS